MMPRQFVYAFSCFPDAEAPDADADGFVERWHPYPVIKVTPKCVYVDGNPELGPDEYHDIWRLDRRQLEHDGWVPSAGHWLHGRPQLTRKPAKRRLNSRSAGEGAVSN